MRTLAIMAALLFVCATAYGVVLYDEAVDGLIYENAGSQPWDTIGMAGMTAGSDPSNTITGGTHQILGHTNTGGGADDGGDGDAWNFSPAGEWSMSLTDQGGIQFIWVYYGHDKSGGEVQSYWNNCPISWPASGTAPAGDYSIGFYDSGGGNWQFEITVEASEPPEPVIPEPAGLGLVGLALLAVRKRRS